MDKENYKENKSDKIDNRFNIKREKRNQFIAYSCAVIMLYINVFFDFVSDKTTLSLISLVIHTVVCIIAFILIWNKYNK